MRQDKDRTAKWLLTHHGDSILRLANIRDFVSWRPAATEVVAPRRIPDGLLEVWYPGDRDPSLVLVEIESYPGRDVDDQVLDDLELVHVDRGVVPDVVCLILLPKGNQQAQGSATRQSRRASTTVSATWPVVNLWELGADLFERMHTMFESSVLEEIKKTILQRYSAEVREKVLAEVFAEELNRGRVSVIQEMLIDNLEARFGALPESVLSKVTGVQDPARLKTLNRLIPAFKSLEEFSTLL